MPIAIDPSLVSITNPKPKPAWILKMKEQLQTFSIQPHQFIIDSLIEDNEQLQSPISPSLKPHKMEHQANESMSPPIETKVKDPSHSPTHVNTFTHSHILTLEEAVTRIGEL